jgi:NADH-quinone oxidoreductase subunit J
LKIAGAIAGGSLLLVLIAALRNVTPNMAELATGDIGLIQNLGKVLFSDYVVPFEISSVLFLSAMVGAVVIGKRDKAKVSNIKGVVAEDVLHEEVTVS